MPDDDLFLSDRAAEALTAARRMLALAPLMRGRSQHAYMREAGRALALLRRLAPGDGFRRLLAELGIGRSRAFALMHLADLTADEVKAELATSRQRDSARHKKARKIKGKRTKQRPK